MGDILEVTPHTFTGTEQEFYLMLGPLLISKATYREIGSPINHYDGKMWIAFTNQHREVVGFYSFSVGLFEELYVLPKFRIRGLADYMVKHWKQNYEQDCKVVCNTKSKRVFLNNGFALSKEYTKWFHLTYTKEIANGKATENQRGY